MFLRDQSEKTDSRIYLAYDTNGGYFRLGEFEGTWVS